MYCLFFSLLLLAVSWVHKLYVGWTSIADWCNCYIYVCVFIIALPKFDHTSLCLPFFMKFNKPNPSFCFWFEGMYIMFDQNHLWNNLDIYFFILALLFPYHLSGSYIYLLSVYLLQRKRKQHTKLNLTFKFTSMSNWFDMLDLSISTLQSCILSSVCVHMIEKLNHGLFANIDLLSSFPLFWWTNPNSILCVWNIC